MGIKILRIIFFKKKLNYVQHGSVELCFVLFTGYHGHCTKSCQICCFWQVTCMSKCNIVYRKFTNQLPTIYMCTLPGGLLAHIYRDSVSLGCPTQVYHHWTLFKNNLIYSMSRKKCHSNYFWKYTKTNEIHFGTFSVAQILLILGLNTCEFYVNSLTHHCTTSKIYFVVLVYFQK